MPIRPLKLRMAKITTVNSSHLIHDAHIRQQEEVTWHHSTKLLLVLLRPRCKRHKY